jgi:hypothetical protein
MKQWTEELIIAVAFVIFILAIWFGMAFVAHGGHVVLGVGGN